LEAIKMMNKFNKWYIEEKINDLENRLENLKEEYDLKVMELEEEGLTEEEIEEGLYELYEEIEDVEGRIQYWSEI
jgi:hypothetical protein